MFFDGIRQRQDAGNIILLSDIAIDCFLCHVSENFAVVSGGVVEEIEL